MVMRATCPATASTSAAGPQVQDTLRLDIHFPQGYSRWYPDFDGNRQHLDEFVSGIELFIRQRRYGINSLTITGSASPEGREDANYRLSVNRAATVLSKLRERLDLPDSCVSFRYMGANWSGLEEIVESRSDVPSREKVLEILRTVPLWVTGPDGNVVDGKKRRLQMLDGGSTWNWMFDKLFPMLRNSGSGVECTFAADLNLPQMDAPASAEAEYALVLPRPQIQHIGAPVPEPEPWFAVGTNLLYDLAATPNLRVEYPLKDGKWSVGLNYEFPWWVWAHNSRAWENLHWEAFGRRYLGNAQDRPLFTGTFLEAALGGGYYDVEPHHKGWQGEFVNAGFGIGHSWFLAPHWRLEAGGSLGIMATKFRFYRGVENDRHLVWQHNGRYFWAGPVKLNVSLSYIIFRNKRKGGSGR